MKATFQLDARDRFGNQIADGADLFFADASSPAGQNVTAFIGVPSLTGEGGRLQIGSILITRSAAYSFRLLYNGTGSNENPYAVTVIANDAVASSSLQLNRGRNITTSTDYFIDYQIQLRDLYGNWRTKGGDNLVAVISKGPISDVGALSVNDNQNGSFTVFNRLTRSGVYTIDLGLQSVENALPFSPVTITVVPGAPTASVSRAFGDSLRNGVAGNMQTFSLSVFDKFANPATYAGLNLEIALFFDAESFVKVDYAAITYASGTYGGQYQQTRSGSYVITLLVLGEPIFASPFSIFIDAAEITTADSAAFQTREDYLKISMPSNVLTWLNETSGFVGGVMDHPFDIMIRARDRFGNAANRAGIVFDVSTDPPYQILNPENKGLGNLFTTFTPTGAGTLTINLKYNQSHIQGSPVQTEVKQNIGVTSGSKCFTLGDATRIGTAGVNGVFILQAADNNARYRTQGGDSFDVTMTMGSVSGLIEIADRASGAYLVTTSATVSGVYTLRISLGGNQVIGSPYSIEVRPGTTSPRHCTIHGHMIAIAGIASTFDIRARDEYSNIQIYNPVDGKNLFSVLMTGPIQYVPSIFDLSNSSYMVRYELTVAGTYSVAVTTKLGPDLVGGNVTSLLVVCSQVDPRSSLVYGAGSARAIAGSDAQIFARLRDVYGNVASDAISTLQALAKPVCCNGTQSLTLTGSVLPDSTLTLVYSLTAAGNYVVSVQALDSKMINASLLDLGGSPFTVVISPGESFAGSSRILLPIVSTARYGDSFTFRIDAYDRFGNMLNIGGSQVSAKVLSASETIAETTDLQNGSYICTFPANVAVGVYEVDVRMQGVLIGNRSVCIDADKEKCASRDSCADLDVILLSAAASCCKCGGGTRRPPFRNVSIIPGPMDVSTSYIVSRSGLTSIAGQNTSIRVARRDQFYNPTFYSDTQVRAQFDGLSTLHGPQFVPALTEDGTELVATWRVTTAGFYQLSVTQSRSTAGYLFWFHITDSPFVVDVQPEVLQPMQTIFSGTALSISTAGVSATFALKTRDVYGNMVRMSSSDASPPFSFDLSSLDATSTFQAAITGMRNGSVVVSYHITRAAMYRLDVWYGHAANRLKVYSYPYLNLIPNAIDLSRTIVPSFNASVTAGTSVLFSVVARDSFSNDITIGGANFSIVDTIGSSRHRYAMTDWANGTYSHDSSFVVAGQHFLDILMYSQRVNSKPLQVLVSPQQVPSPIHSFALNRGTVGGVVGLELEINLYFRDAFDNKLPPDVQANLVVVVDYVADGQGKVNPTLAPPSSLPYRTATYRPPSQGEAKLTITLSGQDIRGSPFSLKFGTTEEELKALPGYGVLSPGTSFFYGLIPDTSAILAGTTRKVEIQAIDQIGFPMKAGGAKCEVTISTAGLVQSLPCQDDQNGKYSAQIFNITLAAEYTLAGQLDDVSVAGKPPYLDEPFKIDVMPAEVSAVYSVVQNLSPGEAGSDGIFNLVSRDMYSNLNATAGNVIVSVTGPSAETNVRVDDNLDGSYRVSYRVTASGSYTASCFVGDVVLPPANFYVFPGPVSADNTVVEGTGISETIAGDQAEFRLTIRDSFGNWHRSGNVSVDITGLPCLPMCLSACATDKFNALGQSKDCIGVHGSAAINVTATKIVQTSMGGGEQMIYSYLSTVSGNYKIFIAVSGVPLPTSPWTARVHAGFVSARKCAADGKGAKEATAGDLATFAIQARDEFSNVLTRGGFSFFVLVQDARALRRQTCTDAGTGLYDCTYMTTIAGSLTLSITSSNAHILGSPFNVPVRPNRFNATTTLVSGLGSAMDVATAGQRSTLIMTARDFLGNYLDTGFTNFVVAIGLTNSGEKLPNCGNMPTGTLVCYEVKDFFNGTYTIPYVATGSGKYTIRLDHYYTVGVPSRVAGSPFDLQVVAADVSAKTSKVDLPSGYACVGSTGTCGLVSTAFPVTIKLQDVYGNLLLSSASASVYVEHNDVPTVLFDGFVTDGVVSLSLVGTHAGAYSLSVSVNAQSMDAIHLNLSPLKFSQNGIFAANGNGLSIATAGNDATFVISTRDMFGNKVITDLIPGFNIRARDSYEDTVIMNQKTLTTVFGSEYTVFIQCNTSLVMNLEVIVANIYVAGMPFQVKVEPGVLVESASTAQGPGVKVGVHSTPTWFTITPRDKYGNALNAGALLANAIYTKITRGVDNFDFPDPPSEDSAGWKVVYEPISVGAT